MTNFTFYLFIDLIILGFINAVQVFDPTSPQQLFFSANANSSPQYNLLITAQSNSQGTFFQFTSPTPKFPSIISLNDLIPVNQTITLQYQNIFTYQQAIQNGLNLTACVNQTMLDCTLDSATNPLCDILVPLPAADQILKLNLNNVNCSNNTVDSFCQFSWNNQELIDTSNNILFTSEDLLCPEALVNIVITVPVLKAQINSLYLVGSGGVTFYYRSIQPVDNNAWTISGSPDRFDEPSDVILNSLVSLTDLDPDDSYETLIKTKLLRHDYPQDIYCRYTINYTGFIRGIYINDYPSGVHAPHGIGLDVESTAESTIRLPLKANQLNFVSIFGYNITQTDLEFIDCWSSWTSNTPLQVDFEYYFYDADVQTPENYTVQTTNYSCSSTSTDCLRCIDSSTCIKCDTSFFQGQCLSYCSGAYPISDYKGICNSVFESGAVLIDVDSANASLDFYNDFESTSPYAIAIFATDQVEQGPQSTIWLSGNQIMTESLYVFVQTLTTGINSISASELGIAVPDLSSLANQDTTAIYYPLQHIDSLQGFYWDLNGEEPTTITEELSPDGSLAVQNGRYVYTGSSYYYIWEAFVNCPSGCELQVRCDGRVRLYKNDLTLLFDVDFLSRWTYVHPTNVTGFVHLRYIVTEANYFEPFITGQNMGMYSLGNPFFQHTIPLNGASQFLLSIPNCTNQNDSICLSCEDGFFLSYDQSSCVENCSLGYYASPFERVCKLNCSENEITVLDQCLPKCDKLGYFYTEDTGCQMCVPECGTCLNETTCLTCRFDDPTNNATFCARKWGTLYSDQDFSISQDAILKQDPDTELALVIADESYWDEQMIYFLNPSRQIPRIMKVLKLENDPDTGLGNVTIPPLSIAQSGSISMHYVKITKDNTSTNYSVTGFLEKYYVDWAIKENVPWIDTTIGKLAYNDPDALYWESYDYTTVIATRFYQHDISSAIQCQLQVKFSGNIRGIYANSELIIVDSTSAHIQKTIISRNFTLEAHEMTLLTIAGYMLLLHDLEFVNCTTTSSQGDIEQVTPTFESYTVSDIDAVSDTFNVTNNTYCPPNCLSCVNASYCLRCHINFYLNNGTCQSKCQDSNAIQLLYGLCDTKPRKQGFKSSSAYNQTSGILTIYYIMPLGLSGPQVLVIVDPYKIYPTSHAAYVFDPTSPVSLAQGTYQIVNFTSSKASLYMNIPVKAEAAADGSNVDVALYTIRQNLMLMMNYSSVPTTLTDLQAADDFEYIPMPTNTMVLDISKTFILDFFINCLSTSCNITFQLEGNIKIVLNERTYLFEGYIESFVGPVSLARSLSGLNHITIQLWNTESFSFTIQGTYNILTQGHFILQDHLAVINKQVCQVQNCLNCYNSKCISCKDGYSLTSAGQCTKTCPSGSISLLFERVCKVSTSSCSTSTTALVVKRGSSCVWNCLDAPGFYYNVSTGCSTSCNNTCNQCSGPSNSNCLSCNYPRNLTSNFICACPIGTQGNISGGCDSISAINLQKDSFGTSCSIVLIKALLITGELEAYNPTFFWELASDSGSLSDATLQNFLGSQHSNVISIPWGYLQENKIYNISVYYYNVLNLKIQNWTTLDTTFDTIPNVTVLGGNFQVWKSYVYNTIQANFGDLFCFESKLNASWTVISGAVLDSNFIYLSDYPLQAFLPACILGPNTNITLNQRVWMIDNPSIFQDQQVTIQTAPESFEAYIFTSNRYHPENLDLDLSGLIDYYDSCPNRQDGQITYLWLCTKTRVNGTVIDCPDVDGLFNNSRNTGNITVPASYFMSGEMLEFYLSVEKNGIIKNDSIIISIKAANTLIVDLSSQTDCHKYTANKDCIITALVSRLLSNGNQVNLTRSDFQNFTFAWQTYPAVPIAFFYDKMKLLSSQTQIPSNIDSLFIELKTIDGPYTTLSYFSLPINQPPFGGGLTITPLVGTSLVTYFSITANDWQDDDLPLGYQFYYSFIINDSSASLLYPETSLSEVNTLLPSQYTGSPVYIQVTIQDFLGAESQAQTQVQVLPENKTIIQKIQDYNALLQTVNNQSNSSVQNSVLLGIITTSVSDLEQQINSTVSTNPCPLCSNHGSCPASKAQCVCTTGWDLADCSVQSTIVDSIVDLKMDYLQKLIANYQAIQQEIAQVPGSESVLGSEEDYLKALIYQALEEMTENPYFNTNATLLFIENVLEQTLQITNANTTLTVPDEITSVSEILSNMMSFVIAKSCKDSSNFTQGLASKIIAYLDKISESVLDNKIASENATVIDTDNVDMYFQKLSLCDLQNKTVSTEPNAPTISLSINTGDVLNCSAEVNLEYYAFSNNVQNCDTNYANNGTKDVIAVRISNTTTGLPIAFNVSITIKPTTQCPSVCQRFQDNSCSCSNISPFDVKDQVIKLFALSNAANIFNVETLLSFQFWKSVSFWGVTFFSVWFVITLYVVKKKLPTFDVITRYHQNPNKTKAKYFWASFLATHPLLGIYCLYRNDFSKRSRAILYFMRNILLLALTSATNEADSNTTLDFQFNFSDLFNFNIYIIILPFFTVIPICAVITWLIRSPSKEEMQSKKKIIVTFIKTKDLIGIFITGVLFLVSLIVIFVISASQTYIQQLIWTINFIQTVLQDLFVTPLVYLVSQYFAFKFHEGRFCTTKEKVKNLIFRILDPQLIELKTPNVSEPVKPISHKVYSRKVSPTKVTFKQSDRSNENSFNLSDTSPSDAEKILKSMSAIRAFQEKKVTGLIIQNPAVIREATYEDSPVQLFSSFKFKRGESKNENENDEGLSQDLVLSGLEGSTARQDDFKLLRASPSAYNIYDDIGTSRSQQRLRGNTIRVFEPEKQVQMTPSQRLNLKESFNDLLESKDQLLFDLKSSPFASPKTNRNNFLQVGSPNALSNTTLNLSFLRKELSSPSHSVKDRSMNEDGFETPLETPLEANDKIMRLEAQLNKLNSQKSQTIYIQNSFADYVQNQSEDQVQQEKTPRTSDLQKSIGLVGVKRISSIMRPGSGMNQSKSGVQDNEVSIISFQIDGDAQENKGTDKEEKEDDGMTSQKQTSSKEKSKESNGSDDSVVLADLEI